MTRLPRVFMDTWYPKVQGAAMFGIPIMDLTTEELRACAVYGMTDAQEELTRNIERSGNFRRRANASQ